MRSKVDEVRAEIKAIHYQHTTSGTYEGRLSDKQAEKQYRELLDLLPEVPGLTNDEIALLTEEINSKINKIGVYIDPDYNTDTIKSFEDFEKAIERIHYQHRYDAGAMFGTLTEDEAKRDYNTLLSLLSEIPSLSVKQMEKLRNEINSRIDNIPKIEEEKVVERRTYREEKVKAFEDAKNRFNRLGFFTKLKLRRQKQSPEHQDVKFMTAEEINGLYKKLSK